jgi:hypothetical protein
MLSVNSPYFVFQSSSGKKRANSTDRNGWSIGHLPRHWIAKHQFRMRTQAALTETENQVTRAMKQLAQESAGCGPSDRNDTPGDACDDQGGQQLGWANPGADRGTEFHITHAHATQPTENTEKQPTQRYAFKTVPDGGPPVERPRNHNAGKQERKYEPVGDTPATQVSECGDGDDDKRWPQSD